MYTEFYHLSAEPFRLTSDPKFFHLAEPHAAALKTVVDAVVRRSGFVVMTGQIGTGKTTVLHAALEILSERAKAGSTIASAFVLNPVLTRDEFLEMILTEFEVPCTVSSKPARLSLLQKMLLNIQRSGGTSVLIVDEAHLLSSELLEEIRLLSNTDTYQEKLLQIVLCGQPELLPMLRRPELEALQQRIANHCSLRPLTFPEVCDYIAERLHAAGFGGQISYPFPTNSLERIFHLSKGVPRLINLLCDACLNIGYKRQQRVVGPEIVEQASASLRMSEKTASPASRQSPDSRYTGAGGDAVLMTALDALILAMKQRRQSVSE